MNLPLFLPGMLSFLTICLAALAGAAIAVFLLKYKFKYSIIRKILTIIALVPAGLVASYLVFYVVSNAIGRAKVETQLAEMRAQGILLDKESILPNMPENASDNGAYYYNAAFNLMDVSASYATFEKMDIEHSNNILEWNENDQRTARRLFAAEDIKQIINSFRQGAEKPYAVYNRHYDGLNTLLPELKSQRYLLRLIRTKSYCEGLDGNPVAGYDLLCYGLKMITQFKSQRFLISQLINIDSTFPNIRAINELISRFGITTTSAKQLIAELEKLNFNQSVIYALDGEIAMWGDDIFGKIIKGETGRCAEQLGNNISLNTHNILLYASWIWPFFYQDYAYFLMQTGNIKNLFDKPYWAVKNEFNELSHEISNAPRYNLISTLTLPTLVAIRTKTANIESDIDAAKLTLALHIYKNQHGAFPDKLEQLAPQILKVIPVDPISGKPFEYQKTGNAFTLSSVWLKEREQKLKDDAMRRMAL